MPSFQRSSILAVCTRQSFIHEKQRTLWPSTGRNAALNHNPSCIINWKIPQKSEILLCDDATNRASIPEHSSADTWNPATQILGFRRSISDNGVNSIRIHRRACKRPIPGFQINGNRYSAVTKQQCRPINIRHQIDPTKKKAVRLRLVKSRHFR